MAIASSLIQTVSTFRKLQQWTRGLSKSQCRNNMSNSLFDFKYFNKLNSLPEQKKKKSTCMMAYSYNLLLKQYYFIDSLHFGPPKDMTKKYGHKDLTTLCTHTHTHTLPHTFSKCTIYRRQEQTHGPTHSHVNPFIVAVIKGLNIS